MTTLAQLVALVLGVFADHGAHHAQHGTMAGHAWIATRRFLVPICHIPAQLHGTFRCTGWITRP